MTSRGGIHYGYAWGADESFAAADAQRYCNHNVGRNHRNCDWCGHLDRDQGGQSTCCSCCDRHTNSRGRATGKTQDDRVGTRLYGLNHYQAGRVQLPPAEGWPRQTGWNARLLFSIWSDRIQPHTRHIGYRCDQWDNQRKAHHTGRHQHAVSLRWAAQRDSTDRYVRYHSSGNHTRHVHVLPNDRYPPGSYMLKMDKTRLRVHTS